MTIDLYAFSLVSRAAIEADTDTLEQVLKYHIVMSDDRVDGKFIETTMQVGSAEREMLDSVGQSRWHTH